MTPPPPARHERVLPRAQGSELAQLRELQTDAVKLARNLPELKELQEQSTTYLHAMANDLAEQNATGTGKVILSTLEPLLQRVTEVIEKPGPERRRVLSRDDAFSASHTQTEGPRPEGCPDCVAAGETQTVSIC